MPTPRKINRHGAHDIEIVWDDDSTVIYPARFLRLRCPCASCQDEMTGKRIISDSALPILTYPVKIDRVGRYAIRIHWSDNHSTGLFTWEKLYQLAGEIDAWRSAQRQSS
jgi:DUF971 family protein